MTEVQNKEGRKFPLTRSETLLSAFFGGVVGLAGVVALIAATS